MLIGFAGKAACLAFCLLILAASAGFPPSVLLARAGSFTAFRTAATEMRADLQHSILLAAGAATAASLLGGLAGYFVARARGGTVLGVLSIIPYAAPASVVGAGLLGIWDCFQALFLGIKRHLDPRGSFYNLDLGRLSGKPKDILCRFWMIEIHEIGEHGVGWFQSADSPFFRKGFN